MYATALILLLFWERLDSAAAAIIKSIRARVSTLIQFICTRYMNTYDCFAAFLLVAVQWPVGLARSIQGHFRRVWELPYASYIDYYAALLICKIFRLKEDEILTPTVAAAGAYPPSTATLRRRDLEYMVDMVGGAAVPSAEQHGWRYSQRSRVRSPTSPNVCMPQCAAWLPSEGQPGGSVPGKPSGQHTPLIEEADDFGIGEIQPLSPHGLHGDHQFGTPAKQKPPQQCLPVAEDDDEENLYNDSRPTSPVRSLLNGDPDAQSPTISQQSSGSVPQSSPASLVQLHRETIRARPPPLDTGVTIGLRGGPSRSIPYTRKAFDRLITIFSPFLTPKVLPLDTRQKQPTDLPKTEDTHDNKRKEQPFSPQRFQSKKRSRLDNAQALTPQQAGSNSSTESGSPMDVLDSAQALTPQQAGNNTAIKSGSPMDVDGYTFFEEGKGWVSFGAIPTPGSPLDTPQRCGMRLEPADGAIANSIEVESASSIDGADNKVPEKDAVLERLESYRAVLMQQEREAENHTSMLQLTGAQAGILYETLFRQLADSPLKEIPEIAAHHSDEDVRAVAKKLDEDCRKWVNTTREWIAHAKARENKRPRHDRSHDDSEEHYGDDEDDYDDGPKESDHRTRTSKRGNNGRNAPRADTRRKHKRDNSPEAPAFQQRQQ